MPSTGNKLEQRNTTKISIYGTSIIWLNSFPIDRGQI